MLGPVKDVIAAVPFGELVDALSGALVAAGVIRKDRGEPDSAGEEAVPEP